jgi:hypothetical protein
MPSIIDLENTNKNCPFDNSMLKKVVYFGRHIDLDSDENGDNLKDRYICMTCGYEALFFSAIARQDILDDVKESLPNKAQLLDAKEKLRDSRKNHVRIMLNSTRGRSHDETRGTARGRSHDDDENNL